MRRFGKSEREKKHDTTIRPLPYLKEGGGGAFASICENMTAWRRWTANPV